MTTKFVIPADLGQMLSRIRISAGKKQSDISKLMKSDSSRVSRIETNDFSPSLEEIEKFLSAVDTQEAYDYLAFLQQSWEYTLRPPFDHPDLKILWDAEQALQRLNLFTEHPDTPKALLGQAELYSQTLQASTQYLLSTRHAIAYIGSIGVGKTTFLCSQTGLVLPKIDKSDTINKVVLEAGSGGTTICEVRIHQGAEYAISIEPLEDTEVYKLAEDFCAGLKSAPGSNDDGGESVKGVSREIERAIRNMTGLTREKRKAADGKRVSFDPAKELAAGYTSFNEFTSDVQQRLRLWKRQGGEIHHDVSVDGDGLSWLRDIFKKLNNGQHPEFTLPKRIHVFVPGNSLRLGEFELEIVDTKGVDGVVVRTDLQSVADDPHTMTVLCSSYNAAPDISLQSFIEHLQKTGQEETLRDRLAILVLPRTQETKATKDDTGNLAETADEAYDIKLDQIDLTLQKIVNVPIPVYFCDVSTDEPSNITQQFQGQIRKMRQSYYSRITNAVDAADQLIANREEEFTKIALQTVNKDIEIYFDQHPEIPNLHNQIHKEVIRLIREDANARSVWAMTRRFGSWLYLDVYFQLGNSAGGEVRRKASRYFNDLEAVLNSRLGDEGLNPAHAYVREILSSLTDWRKKFYDAVKGAGDLTFRPVLQKKFSLWEACENEYGRGSGFRNRVASHLEKWFEEEEQADLHESFMASVQKAWDQEVLEKLRNLVAKSMEDVETQSL